MAGGRRDMKRMGGGGAHWTRDLGTWYFVTMFHLSCRTQAAYHIMIPNKAQRRTLLNSWTFSRLSLAKRRNDLQNPSPVNSWTGQPVSYNLIKVKHMATANLQSGTHYHIPDSKHIHSCNGNDVDLCLRATWFEYRGDYQPSWRKCFAGFLSLFRWVPG
jgi:hypothetical protein